MNKRKKYSIFISYRRQETADKAEHLFTLLEHKGYRGKVSFDKENFDGRFDLAILKRLDECKDFIVILSQKTLSNLKKEETEWYDRLAKCSIDEFSDIEQQMKKVGCEPDFVRIEIARAIVKGKHIIPIVPTDSNDYKFSKLELPNDISSLLKEHAERYQDAKDFLFKDIFPKIKKRLKTHSNLNIKYVLILLILLTVVVFIKWNKENKILQNCSTQQEFEEFAHKSCFFSSQIDDSISCFNTLKSEYVLINDSKNKDNKDSIRVTWSEECSLQQLRVLWGLINNMMYVEKGIFTMGTANPIGLEKLEHQEIIKDNFYIGKFEVTEREWNIIMFDTIKGSATLPIANVSWEECQDFVRKLQSLTTLCFELPTESQWEYAAKKNGELYWRYAGSNVAEKVANFQGKIDEVGRRSANGLELYDMSGNVSEWCQDGSEYKKRIRGGSFKDSQDEITISYSDAASKDYKSETIGIRLSLKP
jgi:hypothetical protein